MKQPAQHPDGPLKKKKNIYYESGYFYKIPFSAAQVCAALLTTVTDFKVDLMRCFN